MRIAIGSLTLGLLMIGPGQSAPVPKNADEAMQLQMEAVGDRWSERWQGRQHYLFDEQAPPAASTDGNSAVDARACATEAIRVRRPSGSTAVVRVNRCK
jgi:hypothetical protein